MSQGPFHSVASDAFGETFVLVVNGELSSLRKIRASHDIGLIFQLNGVRALRGTLVAVVRSVVLVSAVRRCHVGSYS